jgi:hypothetical protein
MQSEALERSAGKGNFRHPGTSRLSSFAFLGGGRRVVAAGVGCGRRRPGPSKTTRGRVGVGNDYGLGIFLINLDILGVGWAARRAARASRVEPRAS